jgi:hypothetical protein
VFTIFLHRQEAGALPELAMRKKAGEDRGVASDSHV